MGIVTPLYHKKAIDLLSRIVMAEKNDVVAKYEHSFPSAAVDPRLVHRVLLTDPVDFPSLTMSGRPRMTTTQTYTDFSDTLQESRTSTINSSGIHLVDMQTLVRGAARDVLYQRVQTNQSLEPAKEVLLELHNKVRQLIPSRKDLHSLLKDEDVRQAENLFQLQSATLVIAQAILQLESPARSASTQEFIRSQSKSIPSSSNDELNPESISSLITPLFFLLWKVELCAADMQDFYLANVWAPQIHQNGKILEHEHFQSQYGKFADSTTAPNTRQWIQFLLDEREQQKGGDTITSSRQSRVWRQDLLAKGWIEDIMFRSPELPVLALPEILALDAENLADIRQVTRLAMAGSALALHACTSAGQSTDALNRQVQDRSLEVQRVTLVQAMNQQQQRSPADYERVVGDAVVALALQWNSDMDDATVSSLRNRVTVTLRGEDPVLTLLNGRMKECFAELVVKLREPAATSANVVPAALKSGRPMAVDGVAVPVERPSDPFLIDAKQLFYSRGLAFYASDLAQAAKQAAQVIALAFDLYGEVLLDRIILEADIHSELK